VTPTQVHQQRFCPNKEARDVATIVLADDDVDLRAVYGPCLRSAGHEVWEAADGREAVTCVRQLQPDLLLLDIWMPHFNGFEVLDMLRHDPAATRLKVVVLSNLGDADSRLEAFGCGAVEYLVKGLALSDLLAKIDSALAEAALAVSLD
jgi:CheY-like chemotaxis protein